MYKEVSSFQEGWNSAFTVHRGVLVSVVGIVVPLYTEMSSLQGVGFHCTIMKHSPYALLCLISMKLKEFPQTPTYYSMLKYQLP